MTAAMLLVEAVFRSSTTAQAAEIAVTGETLASFDLIEHQCAPMIAAVRRAGGQMLYRGAPDGGLDKPRILNEKPDLLDPKTYGPDGAAFFRRMQEYLQASESEGGATAAPSTRTAYPSYAHIAVADMNQAALWGEACSCWPIGSFQFLYLETSALIYPPTPCASSSSSSSGGGKDSSAAMLPSNNKEQEQERAMFAREIRRSEGLEAALVQGQEVMFVAQQGYWLCPARLDAPLRHHLGLPLSPPPIPPLACDWSERR